jgi:hypothetical protein
MSGMAETEMIHSSEPLPVVSAVKSEPGTLNVCQLVQIRFMGMLASLLSQRSSRYWE